MMSMGKRVVRGWAVVSIITGIAYSITVWTTEAADLDLKTQVSDMIGRPLTDTALNRSRAQRIDTPITLQPSELASINVIFWDETRRPTPPPPADNSTGMTSTINNAPY
jgi:hypothetical protein